MHWDRYSLELAIDNDSAPHYSLEATDQEVGLSELQQLAHDNQSIAGHDRFSKAYLLETSESNDVITEQFVFV